MGSGGTQLKAALDEGAGTPDTIPQPTASGHVHRTLGPQCGPGPRPPHGVVRANKLILSLKKKKIVSYSGSQD